MILNKINIITVITRKTLNQYYQDPITQSGKALNDSKQKPFFLITNYSTYDKCNKLFTVLYKNKSGENLSKHFQDLQKV